MCVRVCVLACVHSWEVGGEYTESDARPLRLDRINHVNDRGTLLAGGLLVGGGAGTWQLAQMFNRILWTLFAVH